MKFENLLNPISKAELERRWSDVRAGMEAQDLDALVMQNSNDYLGGYVRWFTDTPATNGGPIAVIFFRTEPMLVVKQGAQNVEETFEPDHPVYRGIGKRISSSGFCSAHYTGRYDVEIVVRELRQRNCRCVGLVGTAGMYFQFCAGVKEGLEGVAEVVESSELVDRIKAIKSSEEIGWIRKTARMQDEVMRRVVAQVKPGMRDFEVTALAQYMGHSLQSEQGTFNGASAPMGQRYSMTAHRHEQGRTIREGDYWNLLIENNGPGGFYTEIARTIVFGNANAELKDAFEVCLEAQRATVQKLRPGVSCRDVYFAHNTFMRSRGRPEEKRLYAHGQGYDLVERPLVRSDETMSIERGMNLAVHPSFKTRSTHMFVCDNFLVNESGAAESLHALPHQIFEV